VALEPVRTLLVAFLCTGIGVGIGYTVKRDSVPPTVFVYKDATDQQLLDYWFGPTDKSALRKRICK
jgi:hypothetical protein